MRRLSFLLLSVVLSSSCVKQAPAEPSARASKPALPAEVQEKLARQPAAKPAEPPKTRLVTLPDGTVVEEQLR